MPGFTVKVSYNGLIRKITITDGTFPSFSRLSDKIRSLYNIPANLHISAQKVIYSPDGNGKILVAHKVSNDQQFKDSLAQWGLYGSALPPNGSLRMDIVTSTSPAATVVKPAANSPKAREPLSDSENELPDLIDVGRIPANKANKATAPQAAPVPAASSISQTLSSTLQSSLKTLETLRRLSPPTSTIPLATPSSHQHTTACSHSDKPVAPVSLTREDLVSALANTKEEIKGMMTHFLQSYVGKMGETFGSDHEIERTVPGSFELRPETTPRQPVHLVQNVDNSVEKELEVWFDAEGTKVQVWCDDCGQKVGGLRFKCLDCSNYDLCSICVPALSTTSAHPVQHRFQPIPHPLLASHLDSTFRAGPEQLPVTPIVVAAAPAPFVRHNASCDFCETMIEGNRFKCLDCPDFDACDACFRITEEQHPGHAFVTIKSPSDYKSARTSAKSFHRGIVCDGCNSDIVGIRYKCVHPGCPDFDLCENCEAAPIARHPLHHPLLKLRFPLAIDAKSSFDDDEITLARAPSAQSVTTAQLQSASASPSVFRIPSGSAPASGPSTPAVVEEPIFAALAPQEMTQTSPSLFSSRAPSFVADLTDAQATAPTTVVAVKQEEDKNAFDLKTGLHSSFVEDITVKDGASFPAGALFTKTWLLKNNGTTPYDPSTVLRFSNGEKLHAQDDSVHVGSVAPGESFQVEVSMKAPEQSGKFTAYWKLRDDRGESFGDTVWTEIIVVDPSLRAPSSGASSISSSSIIMPAAPSVVPTTTGSSSVSSASNSTDEGSDVESVGSMSAFGEIEEGEGDEDDEEGFVVVQDERR